MENKLSEKGYPLVIVFYLNKEMMANPQIINPYVGSINDIIEQKEANAIALFMPTDGEDRVEVLNPVLLHESKEEEYKKLIDDIRNKFDIQE
jgi:tRNA1(Val) A37 N6-methylase TrmN6